MVLQATQHNTLVNILPYFLCTASLAMFLIHQLNGNY